MQGHDRGYELLERAQVARRQKRKQAQTARREVPSVAGTSVEIINCRLSASAALQTDLCCRSRRGRGDALANWAVEKESCEIGLGGA